MTKQNRYGLIAGKFHDQDLAESVMILIRFRNLLKPNKHNNTEDFFGHDLEILRFE